MKIILSHPTANANVRAALEGMEKAEILKEFHTTLASFPGNWLDKLSRFNAFAEINRRSFKACLQLRTQMHPIHELGRMLAIKTNFNNLIRPQTGIFSIDAVYNQLDKKVARSLYKKNKKGLAATGIYAYEDGAIHSFNAAKNVGLQCFYDLPIGYYKAGRYYLQDEKEKWPEWASTLTGLKDPTEKLDKKDRELALADSIFVASSFTAGTLKNFEGTLAPVKIIPYGYPPVVENRTYSKGFNKPLKMLFVGGLSQRKGIAELFNAVNYFGNRVSLTVIGKRFSNDCKVLNKQLLTHNWIPTLPHPLILEQMQQHDVLIFPSLFEGFGLVISEAMSQGTPVITTERTAGPDLIRDNENGWLIKAGSSIALIEKIDTILNDRKGLVAVAQAAMSSAKNRPWNMYGNELAEAIINTVN